MQARKIVLLTAASVLFSSIILGQNSPASPVGRISFDVAEAVDNLPLSRVFVYVHNGYSSEVDGTDGRKDSIVKLDDKGKAEIALRPGLYDVFISKAGFSPKCRVIEVLRNQTTPMIERFVVDEEHQQQ